MVTATLPSSTTATQPNAVPVTTTLILVAQLLHLSQYWVNEQTVMGERVARARRYYDGDHDQTLSPEMQAALRVKNQSDGMAVNVMTTVVDTMADRCVVQAIEGIEDDAADQTEGVDGSSPTPKTLGVVNDSTKWAQEVQDNNDFDVVQGQAHGNAICDGNTYIMCEWNNDTKQAEMHSEPAWDGQSGMLMVYPSRNIHKPSCAIKIWQIDDPEESGNSLAITTRMNVYYDDRVKRYESKTWGAFQPYNGDDGLAVEKWDYVDGRPIGNPVIHFPNGGRNNFGVSELRNAIPVQNAMNRFYYSAVMAAELTAFDIYLEINLGRTSTTVAPGLVVKVDGATNDYLPPDMRKLGASDISSILAMIDSARHLIAEITRTPSPDLASGSGSNKSGEYLKQLEVGLLGKVKRFTIRAGSSWEQVFDLLWKIQMAYGTVKPPPKKRFSCRWQAPEIRNDAEIVSNAIAAAPVMGRRQTMRNMAEPFELDEEKIDAIIEQDRVDQADNMTGVTDSVNPATGKVTPQEAPITVGGQPQSQPTAPTATANKPAIRGTKLPPDQAFKVNPITHEELAAVGAMHRSMVGK